MKTKFPPAALEAARALRIGSESGRLPRIAKTWDEYFAEQSEDELVNGCSAWLNAYTASKLVEEQAKCSFREAYEAVQLVFPELLANYWETLPAAWESFPFRTIGHTRL